ncbi:MAG TPA: endolytic transglycosylase MltG [bacterium]|nr:endolytic transglycosylase MltG [bacterium]
MVRRPGYLVVGSVLVLLMVFMGALVFYGQFSTGIETTEPVSIEVHPGETLRQVTRELAGKGLLRHPHLFTLLGILRGDSANIKAGQYVVKGAVTPNDLLDELVSGRARFVSLTVPEGFSLAEIAARVEERQLGRADAFLALAHDPRFIATLPLPVQNTPPSLEGFLFPETYFFHRGVGEAAVIMAMVHEFNVRAAPVLRQRAGDVGMTPYQALILASIVEKETAVPSERPLISAVFHNRLRARMRLASDPTVIYGLANYDGNLRHVDLITETPYNTYKIRGLPPTPIASPGIASINAAVAPADVDYLFFVAKGDGTHVFTKDYRDHRRAVWKYQIRPYRKHSS